MLTRNYLVIEEKSNLDINLRLFLLIRLVANKPELKSFPPLMSMNFHYKMKDI